MYQSLLTMACTHMMTIISLFIYLYIYLFTLSMFGWLHLVHACSLVWLVIFITSHKDPWTAAVEFTFITFHLLHSNYLDFEWYGANTQNVLCGPIQKNWRAKFLKTGLYHTLHDHHCPWTLSCPLRRSPIIRRGLWWFYKWTWCPNFKDGAQFYAFPLKNVN